MRDQLNLIREHRNDKNIFMNLPDLSGFIQHIGQNMFAHFDARGSDLIGIASPALIVSEEIQSKGVG